MRGEVITTRKIQLPPGFTLEEVDEDVVHLHYGAERIATFAARGVDPKVIQATAEAYLAAESR